MLPTILLRRGFPDTDIEARCATDAGFHVIWQRSAIVANARVFGRYSVLPFYRELEDDIRHLGGSMLQTYAQHRYIADLGNWVSDLAELTPETWARIEDIPADEGGPFVVKGATNSRKDRWKTHMFAATKQALHDVWWRCLEDANLESQGLYVRKLEPFVTYLTGVGGQPITNEWRVCVANGQIVDAGYYWSNYDEETRDSRPHELPAAGRGLVTRVVDRVGSKAFCYTVDIAEHQDGRWRVVELNDLQMSGLSTIPPERFYSRLAEVLREPLARATR